VLASEKVGFLSEQEVWGCVANNVFEVEQVRHMTSDIEGSEGYVRSRGLVGGPLRSGSAGNGGVIERRIRRRERARGLCAW
jgi:hypothetical protein